MDIEDNDTQVTDLNELHHPMTREEALRLFGGPRDGAQTEIARLMDVSRQRVSAILRAPITEETSDRLIGMAWDAGLLEDVGETLSDTDLAGTIDDPGFTSVALREIIYGKALRRMSWNRRNRGEDKG